ncbi:GatB/YqeY domain-containing protein [Kiloniella laminariae]|uniref:GatB/YqeY domain-containing protein n=1 Tax=Kiloniella laminariae TaxID=454162 RepID=A0ABT4LE89_9PROT|nr:GatB/YqeY domain-containing protein [Kiloniella laminariae]MCZ4279240.1 GatB/YqeY domain-containing protein [Kiloniella laminariae]
MLRNSLNDALKEAMRSKDKLAISTLRLILAALKDRDIAARGEARDQIGEEEVLEMLQKMIRQRRDSVEMYEKAGRSELAERELSEITVIEGFLPQQMSAEEVEQVVTDLVAELGADSIKDMGRVMGVLKERYAGKMDFGKASGLVKTKLV